MISPVVGIASGLAMPKSSYAAVRRIHQEYLIYTFMSEGLRVACERLACIGGS